ncbi:hypothetical protein CEP53_007522 [Fusarium sp. AF-6]|nr:hypothetical protein CEP53_007522 [Fusarium sp. AF-6]
MASLKRKRLNSSSSERAANTVESLRADGSSRVQVGNSYTEVHNYEGRQVDDECLRDLRTTDPRDDKTRITKEKGGLLPGSSDWVLESFEFQQWVQGTENCLLWVKGDPGKGKTMLLCGLIDELTKSQHVLSYFFCQATDSRINNAASVLRGLIYLLVVQKISLTCHVRKKWDHGGKSTFEPPNGWHVLCNMFEVILGGHRKPTYLVIDALDECEDSSLPSLLDLIVSTASKYTHVKWLVSSRNLPDIECGLGGANMGGRLDISLEANASLVSKAVAHYINRKIDNLAKLRSDANLRKEVKETMQLKANGTFLWAALAFEELKAEEDEELEDNSEILDVLNQVPEGLTNLYDRMWRQLSTQGPRNSSSCKIILATMFLAYRPLQLQELPNIYGLHNPGVLTSEIEMPVPDPLAALRYSCIRWLDHFYEGVSSEQDRDQNDANVVTSFLQDKYLYWLEALGLCGSVTEGIASIRKLEALAVSTQSVGSSGDPGS